MMFKKGDRVETIKPVCSIPKGTKGKVVDIVDNYVTCSTSVHVKPDGKDFPSVFYPQELKVIEERPKIVAVYKTPDGEIHDTIADAMDHAHNHKKEEDIKKGFMDEAAENMLAFAQKIFAQHGETGGIPHPFEPFENHNKGKQKAFGYNLYINTSTYIGYMPMGGGFVSQKNCNVIVVTSGSEPAVIVSNRIGYDYKNKETYIWAEASSPHSGTMEFITGVEKRNRLRNLGLVV